MGERPDDAEEPLVFQLLPFLFPVWAIGAILTTWITDGGILPLIIPTVGVILLMIGIGATRIPNDIIIPLSVGSMLVLFAIAGIAMVPFYGWIAWYLIADPIVALTESALSSPVVSGAIIAVVGGTIAGSVLYTLWRTDVTAKPLLMGRMILSLAVLCVITIAFLTSIWRAFESSAWVALWFPSESSLSSLIAWILLVAFVYYELQRFSHSDQSSDTTPATRNEYPTLHVISQRVAVQLNIPSPTIVISDEDAPVAVAHGYRPGNIQLVLSQGLLTELDESELLAVIAHELAHVANMDAMVMSFAAIPLQFADGLKHRVNELRGIDTDRAWESEQPERTLRQRVIRIPLLLILSPLFITWYLIKLVSVLLSYLTRGDSPHELLFVVLLGVVYVTKRLSWPAIAALSRGRESAADQTAAVVTGSPGALASALETLDDRITESPTADLRETDRASFSILPLDPIVGPDDEADEDRLIGSMLTRIEWWLFATHPSTDKRIKTLREMGAEQS